MMIFIVNQNALGEAYDTLITAIRQSESGAP